MGSSLDAKYSVAHMATKMDWYTPCMIWSRGGSSIRSVCGAKGWEVDWVCGRGVRVYVFEKGVSLGYLDGVFLGWVNGCELGASDGVFLGNFEWTLDG